MQRSKETIYNELTTIFRDVFDDEEIVLSPDTTADDIDEWDSLSHIVLVVSIEKKFNIKLNAAQVGKLENVSAMVALLENKNQTTN